MGDDYETVISDDSHKYTAKKTEENLTGRNYAWYIQCLELEIGTRLEIKKLLVSKLLYNAFPIIR